MKKLKPFIIEGQKAIESWEILLAEIGGIEKIEKARFYIDKTNYYEGMVRITQINKYKISLTAVGKLIKKKE